MVLRTDHIAGAAFVLFGLLIFAMSGDLPTGDLSMPGAGFLPKLVAGLMIILGAALALRAGEETLAAIPLEDARHAGLVIIITAAAIALYTVTGFVMTMIAMMLALLLIIEGRRPLPAATYSVCAVVGCYALFKMALKAPLPLGPFGF